jgi:hypothetical protein
MNTMKRLLINQCLFAIIFLYFHHPYPASASAGMSPMEESGAQQEDFEGNYTGNINGTAATMRLKQDGSKISGSIDAGGYMYQVTGTEDGQHFRGSVFDPQTQGTLQCQGNIDGDQLNLVINTLDQSTGQYQEFKLEFKRDSGQATAADTREGNGAGGGITTYDRDPGLIGSWLYSESYTSGGYGFASQWRLIINADGTYLYGDAKVAGGGSGIGGASGGSGYTRGQWGTRNMTIYINEGYGWQPYAGYYLEGASMLMKFADGSKQVWKRTY